jgi:dCTP deaminase
MILANVEIHRALDEGDLIIVPEPLPRFPSLDEPSCPYDTTAVDLSLADELSFAEDGPYSYDLRSGDLATFLGKNSRTVRIDSRGGYALEPNAFVLGRTIERVHLPIRNERPNLAARVEGKSSRARCGLLIHFTAPTIHAGFDGTITLEMINLGPRSILLSVGLPICQLIFERVSGLPTKRPSQFQGQNTAVGVKTSG